MGLFVIGLSDVGEGVAEAEVTEWHVAVGDTVCEDQMLAVVMTDKAAVDVPSSVLGRVVKLCADVGEVVAVGSDLIHIEIEGEGNAAAVSIVTTQSSEALSNLKEDGNDRNTGDATVIHDSKVKRSLTSTASNKVNRTKVLAAPSVRQRLRELDIDNSTVLGSGPAGRIIHADLDRLVERRAPFGGSEKVPDENVSVIKVVGMRRKIAERMSLSSSRIPHITIVEEIDMQNLEELRIELNEKHNVTRGKLTILPFVMKSIVEAVREQPELNALFDDEAGSVAQHAGVHIGVAAQTPSGLVVPVVRHSEMNSLWKNASEIVRLSEACRDGSVHRNELSGSTITITSLGRLGAVATTPIINHPEVAIVGINKMMIRPVWDGKQFVPRKMMNISCSFDHRVVDGWDAAVFVQKLKSLLEMPAMLFLEN